ncbi:MAG: GNAT family N-acetyltransferase [Flavobacteriales bacterium]|nr:GNAT family N-acetyltransferase [Flavobacteriales bacterium]
MGFAFLPSYSNKAYAFEASKITLNYIEKSTDFQAVLAVTVPQNKSSVKLIKKLGLIFYKTEIHENDELQLYKIDLGKV